MLQRLYVKNFTVFAEANFDFGPGLNVVVGTNGTGKSHVLKLGYAMEAAEEAVKHGQFSEAKKEVSEQLREARAHYLSTVFLLEEFHDIIRDDSYGDADLEVITGDGEIQEDVTVEFDSDVEKVRAARSLGSRAAVDSAPIFIPPKEVLSIFPGLGSLARKYRISFDQTYIDLLDALELPPLRQLSTPIERLIKDSLQPIMQGRIVLEGGRFYLILDNNKRIEINLAAEGIRKFGMLAQLLNNGSLTPQTTLFWDEPEANLNPALLRKLAAVLAELARQGFQIILATHSLFLLKELHILSRQKDAKKLPIRYFGLNAGLDGATMVTTVDDFEKLPDIVALDAELEQADTLTLVFAQDDADHHGEER